MLKTKQNFAFFDKLFDSFNGSFDRVVNGKIYGTAIKKQSPHHNLWSDSFEVLSTMHFVDKNEKKNIVPTLNNWKITIKGWNLIIIILFS